ncbi:acyl-CoA dehydrogenase family protein [Streptosporangium sp. NPDC051022]|uniref:acyl-CoA dehydrogenase family protein n=1 Tax=Streptosporangium sp. NPDC051022 TaxID=3155752 RepID=UPI003428A428
MTAPDQDELDALRDVVRRLLAKEWGPDQRNALLAGDDGPSRALRERLGRELGLYGLAVPAEYGGAGCGFAELAIVLEELGRTLADPLYLSTAVIGVTALRLSANEELRRAWLPRIADGSVTVALACTETTAAFEPETPRTRAVPAGGEWRVTGEKQIVAGGAEAGLLLVSAATPTGELVLLAVEPGSEHVTVVPTPALDLTRPLATVTMTQAPAQVVAAGREANDLLSVLLDHAAAGLACEQVGGAAHALETTTAWVREREQFGVPIGGFQAVQFACVDMLLDVEAARSAAAYAVAALDAVAADDAADDAGDDDAGDAAVACAVAKAVCSESFVRVTGQMIQLHGGIAYTWEHEAHLYFKRARSAAELFGNADHHREQVLVRMGVRP